MLHADPDPETWLPELRQVVATLARALGGRAPDPSLILSLKHDYESCVPGHVVEIDWYDGDEDEGPLPQPLFRIDIHGDRLLAGWLFDASALHCAIQRLTLN